MGRIVFGIENVLLGGAGHGIYTLISQVFQVGDSQRVFNVKICSIVLQVLYTMPSSIGYDGYDKLNT